MIIRCLKCHSPIFGGSCLCKSNVVRCPDCGGDGRKKVIEFLEDVEGYMGYILKPYKGECSVCGGVGRVTVIYRRFNGG